jgi:putative membrane protein
MSRSTRARKPAAFSLDDPRVEMAEIGSPEEAFVFAEANAGQRALVPVTPAASRRRWHWSAPFFVGAGGLSLLAIGLGIASLIEDLFARSQTLGWTGVALAAVAILSFAVIALREAFALMRLARVDAIRERAAGAIASDDRKQGQEVVASLLSLTRRIPRLARARTHMVAHSEDIIDGRDLVQLAEREMMAPLDLEARRLIAAAARRVSVVTAVSPRAAIDMLFVLINTLSLIRRLAMLYGTRPGTFGLWRLVRHTISHLTLTGGIAMTDSLIQQLVGHGLAAKLSARLGEGVLNGLLTARLGIAAMDVTRPLPFSALPQPKLNDLAGHLLRVAEAADEAARPAAGPRAG